MSSETPTFQPEDDAHTTAPNPEPQPAEAPGKWEMPAPVFQKTSGYLPQGFEKVLAEAKQSGGNATPAAAAAAAPEAAPETPPAVEQQPDISELVFEEAAAVAPAAPKTKSALLRIVLAVMAVGAILFLIAAFLVTVYLLFFPRGE
jgi:hypothetical protein